MSLTRCTRAPSGPSADAFVHPRDELAFRSERARETRMGQGRLEERNVSEGRIAEHHVVRPARPLLEKTQDVRADDFRLRVESRRSDVLSQRLQRVGERSTNVACAAPRESASMPSVPAPAKRSSTRASPRIGSRARRASHGSGRSPPRRSATRRRESMSLRAARDHSHASA